jgi:nucleoside-diphosphate-sugar epimerase
MIILTGGSGFLGSSLIEALHNKKFICIGRNKPGAISPRYFYRTELGGSIQYTDLLRGAKTLIHCAARVHVMTKNHIDSTTAFKEVNTAGTLNLARQAAKSGVKRFIFISTVKVNGEATFITPFTNLDEHKPKDPYGISKSLAETSLLEIARKTSMEIVIIRPPLVYGPNVKANFAALMTLVEKGVPLPFGMVNNNKRSLVYVGNLVDLIINCIENPKAANETFMASDDDDLSTYQLIAHMGKGLGKKTLQLPVPVWSYRLLGKLTGKSDIVNRLVGSLQVDIQHTKDTLNWTPPFTVDQGMAATAKVFLEAKYK